MLILFVWYYFLNRYVLKFGFLRYKYMFGFLRIVFKKYCLSDRCLNGR